jgi:hypothetical protein
MVIVERLADVGAPIPKALIDGSFVTARQEPGDVDAVCHIPANEMADLLARSPERAALEFFLTRPHDTKLLTGVHLFVVATQADYEDLRDTFTHGLPARHSVTGTLQRQLRAPDPIRDPVGLVVPPEKGILEVDFAAHYRPRTP